MLKVIRSPFIFVTALVVLIFLSSCSGKSESVAWKYENKMSQPLEVLAAQQEVKAGDLAVHQFQLTIPGNAFASPTRISVQTPKTVPAINSQEFTPIGAPVEINGAETRLNQPAVLTFQVDKSKYAADLKARSIWITYYDSDEWHYLKPSSTDPATGTVTYQTYHFSLFGAGKISVEERINQYAHSQALGKLAQDKVDDVVDEMIKNTVEYMLKKQMGLDDEAAENSLKFKIMSSLANDDEYRDLIEKFQEGDVEGFNETFNIFVGKKIAENLEDSMWKSTLEFVSDSGTDLIRAASRAAGYAAEGQYLEAGRILGTQIAEEFMITRIIQSGVEIVQYNIDAWKDAEIEAAYQAYKNGADNKFFGYNVDAGDFYALWNQMSGIATRLESEAVNQEMARRESMGMPAPTDRDLDKVRAQVRENLKKDFENRLKSETEIEKNEAKIKALVIKFQESRLLENAMYGYDDTYDDMESRLDKLFHLTQKILRDTGRKDWNLTAFTNEREISANDVIALIKAWYSTNGREEYARMIRERFRKSGQPEEIIVKEFHSLEGLGATIDVDQSGNDITMSAKNIGDRMKVGVRGYEYTLRFWNVGKQGGDDYGKATITITTIISSNGRRVDGIQVDKEGNVYYVNNSGKDEPSPPFIKPKIYQMQFTGGPEGTFDGISDKGIHFKGYIENKDWVIFVWDTTRKEFPVRFKLPAGTFPN